MNKEPKGQQSIAEYLEQLDKHLQSNGTSLAWLSQVLTDKGTVVPMSFPDRETLPIKIETINGEGVVTTLDGKIIGKQVGNGAPHYYYSGYGAGRVTMFRVTLMLSEAMPAEMALPERRRA